MVSTPESQISSLLSALVESEEDSLGCPLGVFARDLHDLLQLREGSNLGDALAERSMELLKEEEGIHSTREMIALTYDKLRAEVTRVEAQIAEQDRRMREVLQQKKLCKSALSILVAGYVPNFVDADTEGGGMPSHPNVRDAHQAISNPNDDDGDLQPASSAPEPVPAQSTANVRKARSEKSSTTETPTTGVSSPSSAAPSHLKAGADTGSVNGGPASPRHSNIITASALLSLLQLPDIKETSLLHAIESYEQSHLANTTSWMSSENFRDVLGVFLALIKHLPTPRPPVQLAELRVLSYAFQASSTSNVALNKSLAVVLDTLLKEGKAVPRLCKLLSSVNDDVKCEVLECLSSLICSSSTFVTGAGKDNNLCSLARREFLLCKGLHPLVNIVVCSTSEAVLERALVLLWGLLSMEEKTDLEFCDGHSVRWQVRELGGLRAVLDLLYTDSLAILENVCMVIGYITRELSSKKEIGEIGGLEKITATLRHPSDSIKTKLAGAMWNCGGSSDNRTRLRQLGAIPALIELLTPRPTSADLAAFEFVRENAAGALWSLSVDSESKAQIIDYGGIHALVQAMLKSSSTAVIENASGTLLNCSTSAEARPIIRKAGGIPLLLGLLRGEEAPTSTGSSKGNGRLPPAVKSQLDEHIVDNVAGILRNCAINDQNKPVIREAGGVELLLERLKDTFMVGRASPARPPLTATTADKLASTLWILTVSPEVKHAVRAADGISLITKLLALSSPTLAAMAKSKPSSHSPFASVTIADEPPGATADYYPSHYAPSQLQRLPSIAPTLSIPMGTREKLVGILRNCSTVPENRLTLVQNGAIRCLVAVMLDCFSSKSIFQGHDSQRGSSRPSDPSLQLRETVASALWYLSRDDKVTPREQGGLQLMCMILFSPLQPSVVLEQAAGALSSLTVNNPENHEAIRQYGGLWALLQIVSDKAAVAFPVNRSDAPSADKNESVSNTFAVLNSLMTLRNSTANSDRNLKYCGEGALANDAKFLKALFHIIEHASDECSREGALTLRNLCAMPKILEYAKKHDAAAILNRLSERASTNAVRLAAAITLQTLNRNTKRAQ